MLAFHILYNFLMLHIPHTEQAVLKLKTLASWWETLLF